MDRHTPNTGLVVFLDSDGVKRESDFLAESLGLTARDVRNTAIRLNIRQARRPRNTGLGLGNASRAMYGSRVYNVVRLRQRGRIALDQLRRSVICA
jgi:hypothetical protein